MTSYGGIIRIRLKGRSSITSSQPAYTSSPVFISSVLYHIFNVIARDSQECLQIITVNLIFSHVNAVKRKQFNGKSAYDMFSFYYSAELASALGISFIPANQVIQSPILLANSFSK